MPYRGLDELAGYNGGWICRDRKRSDYDIGFWSKFEHALASAALIGSVHIYPAEVTWTKIFCMMLSKGTMYIPKIDYKWKKQVEDNPYLPCNSAANCVLSMETINRSQVKSN